ncbi:MAG: hypothetical protein HOA04_08900 [Euryarchaeota archaeon]|jgi:hypothetical protein|nr:hypothetical protein [Euryarchaeota archaeon]MBT7938082.1 hypothetical protein [Euryarchaeota archaeon]
MPACRFCFATYPREFFILGNGPRKDVCQRCGIEEGLIEESEAVMLFDAGLASSRLTLLSRRWAPILWVLALWGMWFVILSSIPTWGMFSLIVLIVVSLVLPVNMMLNRAKYSALFSNLTPAHQRPPGH